MRRRGGWAGLAVLGLAVCAAGGACSDEAGEDDEVRRSGDESVAVAELLATSRRTVAALSSESSMAGIDALGMTGSVAMPADDPVDARRQTDQAIARLAAAVEDHDGVSGPYAEALDALGGVAALREEADGLAGQAGMGNVDAAQALTDRYSEVGDAVEEATGAFALSIDDTGLGRGARLYATALEQSALEAEAARAILYSSVVAGGGLDETEEIRTVAEQVAEMTRARAAIEENARGPYEEPARALLGQLDEAGLLPALEQALETGQVDVAAVLESVEVPAGQGWQEFLDRVEQILTGD